MCAEENSAQISSNAVKLQIRSCEGRLGVKEEKPAQFNARAWYFNVGNEGVVSNSRDVD